MTKTSFAQRFKLARQKAKLSVVEVARKLQVTTVTIWHWEKGTTLPRPSAIPKIAEVLGVDPRWLETGEGDMEPQISTTKTQINATESNFAQRFKLAREKANLSINKIAQQLQVSPATVWQWEKGINVPRPYAIPKIAEVLGVDPHWLQFGETKKEIQKPRTNDKTDFAQRFKLARQRAKLSINKVAQKLQVTPASVWQWEKGINVPRPYAIPKIAEVLGVDPRWLETGEGDMEPRKLLPVYHSVYFSEKQIKFGEPAEFISEFAIPPNVFAFKVQDNLLAPVIFQNDYVIIGKNHSYGGKGIYFVSVNGIFKLRIFEIDPLGKYGILSTLKPQHPTEVVPIENIEAILPVFEIRRQNLKQILEKI